jgi:CBS-domain-containing membrane protein
MKASMQKGASHPLVLEAGTAADIMTPDPVSIRQDAPLPEAVSLLAEKDISALPVLDGAGRPVGVLSRTDIVRHASQGLGADSSRAQAGPAHVPTVQEVMTPALLSVSPSASAVEVVSHLLGLGNVHRIFVVDDTGSLVGVVSARDVLRKLHRLEAQ